MKINTRNNSKLPANAAKSVFGQRLFARFPCPAGQEIARNPPLRVASYVMGQFTRSLKRFSFFDKVFKLTVFRLERISGCDRTDCLGDFGSGNLKVFLCLKEPSSLIGF